MSINICYLILNLLLLIIIQHQINKKNMNLIQNIIVLAIYIIFTFLTCSYLNSVMNNIFKLTYLNVKSYLLLLVITDTIMLYTINKPVKLGYKIPNYILFISVTAMFIAMLPIVLGNKIKLFYIMDIGNAINFMDLSFIVFSLYLIAIAIVYMGYMKMFKTIAIPQKLFLKLPKRKNDTQILTREELLNYDKERDLYINGINVNIIFEDSNKDNIVKNYYLLLKDIDAKLANGYTLEENKLLKNICNKLNVSNLTTIDLNNLKVLDKINSEEYQILKRVTKVN